MELLSVEVGVALVIVVLTVAFISYRLLYTPQLALPTQKKLKSDRDTLHRTSHVTGLWLCLPFPQPSTLCLWLIALSPCAPPSVSSSSSSAATNGSSATSSSVPLLPLSIFFGSQSGTAEAFARELSEEAKLYGFQGTVKDLEDYDPDDLSKEPYAVFLMATFGEGEPTDNAATFYAWLMDEQRSSVECEGVKFAVFALGNRQYEHFCLIGNKVDERMAVMGGQRVVDKGEGDDDGSLEGDFRQWKSLFWQKTNALFGTGGGADGVTAEVKAHVSSFLLTPLPASQQAQQAEVYTGGLTNLVTDPKHRVQVAKVVVNRELRQSTEDDGSTRHVEIDLSSVSLPYLTSDNCGIYPRNDHRLVASLCKRLGLDSRQLLVMKGNGTKRSFLPSPCSVQDIFLYYLDITFTPRLSQLPMFVQYTTDEKEKAQLLHWSRAGQDEYLQDHKTFVELLMELPSLSPPLDHIVDWTPHLAPRFYTISSSSLVQPKQLSLTVSVLTHHKPRGRKQAGICSSYLAQLRPEKDSVALFIRPSSFRLPKPKPSLASSSSSSSSSSPSSSPSSLPPILMIGPGTGVAPFRAFIQEATWQKTHTNGLHANNSQANGITPSPSPSPAPRPAVGYGELILFFGCRSSSKDFIYRDELLKAQQDGVLTELHLAFSREVVGGQDSTASDVTISASATAATTASLASSSLSPAHAHSYTNKVYVQDRMRGVGEGVWEWLHHRKGYVFVCGGTAMGRSVREVLLECCREKGGMTDKAADLYIKKMQEQKRYVQELWS